MMDTLAVNNLTVEFHRQRHNVEVVRDLTISVGRGHRLAIVGESGSGKSVTALAITRLLGPTAHLTAGTVSLDKTNLLELPERAMESVRGGAIAMVFQDALTALDPLFTIEQQLAADPNRS